MPMPRSIVALSAELSWAGLMCGVQAAEAKLDGSLRLHPRLLAVSPLVELKAEGAWLFPKLRLVEVYLAFVRVWLRRELQRRGKFADLKLADEQWGEKVAAEEEHCLDYCRRLAFAMFKRGVTSWTMQRREPQEQQQPVNAGAGQVKVNLKPSFLTQLFQAAGAVLFDAEMKGQFDEQDCVACCPLRRSGDSYSFLHKSLQDCFAALHMADQICEWQLNARKQPPPTGLLIGEKFLTGDAGVLKCLAQLVDQRVWAYRRQGQAAVDADDAMQPLGRGLWDLVYESRRLQPGQQAVCEAKLSEADEGVVRAAANAISVLVCAGVSMAGE